MWPLEHERLRDGNHARGLDLGRCVHEQGAGMGASNMRNVVVEALP
jgi:hypothetical protein